MVSRQSLAFVPVLLLACNAANLQVTGLDAGAPEAVPASIPPSPCQDDQLGNPSQSRSHQLTGAGDLLGLVLCPGTEDWFRLDARDAASFGVGACVPQPSTVPFEFTAYRWEFEQLFPYGNCGSSGAMYYCQDTCRLEAPGIYYFRLGAAAQSLRYNLTVAYEKEVSRSTEIPPGFDVAPVLAPGVAREVTVCAPFGK